MWKSQNLFPVENWGALKNLVLGFVLMLIGVVVLYYGNILIENVTQDLGKRTFGPMLFGVTFSIFVHGLQILLMFLAWLSIGNGMSCYFGKFELTLRLIVPTVGIWMTWSAFPLLSHLLTYSSPINLHVTLLLLALFQVLTIEVDNWMDKGAAMMLWVYSFQSLELLPTFLVDGQTTSSFFGSMLRSDEEIVIASMTGASLFLSFMAGAVISTWVLSNYSVKLSQVRRSWEEELGETKEDEDDGFSNVSMVDVRSLAHDLKTPLTAIKGIAYMLRDGYENFGDDTSEKVDVMLSATNYMERMIGEILYEDRLHEVQVEPFFDRLGRYIRPFPWGEDVSVSMSPDSGLETMAVNEIRFTRALLNVLDNAWRANRMAGTQGIELHVRRSVNFLEIEVLDNGPGIDQSTVHHKSGWGSTGLGLAFARKVAAVHGGNLILSQRRDAPHGTSVLISLPILGV